MTIFINYRVFDYDRNYIGATGVGLTVSAIKKLIEVYQEKYNRTIYFIDRNGEIKLAGSGFDNTIKNISQLEYYALFEDKLSSKSEYSFTSKKDGQVVHTISVTSMNLNGTLSLNNRNRKQYSMFSLLY